MYHNLHDNFKPGAPRKFMLLFAIGWTLLLFAGFLAVYQFTKGEQQRDEQQWQRQLQLTAEAQRRQVEQWLNVQQSVITGLAENTSLQLYLTELNGAAETAEASDVPQDASASINEGQNADPAFTSFLRSLLISEAEQHGFYEANESDSIPANVPTPIGSGLAILNKDGAPIVSTQGMPELAQLPAGIAEEFKAHTASPIGPFLLENGKLYLLFTAPIQSVQSDGAEAAQGYILGVKMMDQSFAELLQLPPQATPTSETVLVRKKGESLEYITSLQDGTKPLSLSLNYNTPNLAESTVVTSPGIFIQNLDYRNQNVMAVGQPIAGTDWVLIHKVDTNVALHDTVKRKQAMLIGYLLLTAFVSAAIIAIWRNLSARRARQLAMHYQQLANSAEQQKSLLSRLINTLIMLVDSRDPHAQHHSNGVALIAESVAKQMELPENLQETAALAASLMNVGKIKTPETLLIQKDLSIEDKNTIRQSMLASADLLKDITFNGPVVETLQQAHEHVDGSGPLGLTEDEILVSAKIIAVANAFIAMISKRAYRNAMTMEEALDVIRGSVDRIYSRPVVAALEHYLENGGGREAIMLHMRLNQKSAA